MAARTLPRRAAVLALLSAALGGCKLIDQNTFWPPKPPPPPPPAPPPPPPGPPPLVLIRFDHPGVEYKAALSRAVADALARKPDVVFDVQGVAPVEATVAAQGTRLIALDAELRDVGDTIAAAGAPPSQIALSSRGEAGLRFDEVRVYVH